MKKTRQLTDEKDVRPFLRFWTQGIIANYSSSNVNGAFQIVEVTEGTGYTDVVIEALYGYRVVVDGRDLFTKSCRISVTITAEVEEEEHPR